MTESKNGLLKINQQFVLNYIVVPRFYSCFTWPLSNHRRSQEGGKGAIAPQNFWKI